MLKTMVEQLADQIREDLKKGRWIGTMPGRARTARELGVNGRTVDRALELLEKEGWLESQGPGRSRKITKSGKKATTLRVKVILYVRDDANSSYILRFRRRMEGAGHQLDFASKTLVELKQDVDRVARLVRSDPADAWILLSGARPVVEWFSNSNVPAFCLFGSIIGLPIAGAGPDKLPALDDALHSLFGLGHRRIVMLTREERRKPKPGIIEQTFLQKLMEQGIRTGSYNLPVWEESAEGLRRCLDELFEYTPPTAILVSDPLLCLPVKNYLASKKDLVFREVAVICNDHISSFEWCAPPIPHFQWDERAVVQSAVRWVNNLARGKVDKKQVLTPAKYIGGETLPRVG